MGKRTDSDPKSLATCVRLFPLLWARRTASSLNSCLNVHYSFGLVLLSFRRVVSSTFLDSTRAKEDQL
jgi:hypothetical protein